MGMVWALGFGITEFAPEKAGIGWLVLDGLGIAASVVDWLSIQVIAGVLRACGCPVLFLLAGAVSVRGDLVLDVSAFGREPDRGVLGDGADVCVCGGRALAEPVFYVARDGGDGADDSGLTLIPAHFNLLMSLVGGGSLMVSGIYIRKAWR